ncbi:MAG: CoA pyrophosphatase, partial [Alphaproteobacteria bacterium]|nr:CoA pyrophosphatase [Alphaproteobacteria bacterium]
ARHEIRSAIYEGRERHYYEIRWQGRRIWGATAAMIVNLSRRMELAA